MHCMEQNNQIAESAKDNPWKTFDYSHVEKTLTNDALNYFKNRLEEYKKTDFTIQDMEHVNYMSVQLTGKPNLLIYNSHSIKDDKNNTFLHIAIRKADLAVATWFLKNKCWSYNPNTEGKAPIDLCIDQLLPTAPEKNKKVAGDMLDVLITEYEKANFNSIYKKSFIIKLITLELEHKKAGTNFTLKDSWLPSFLKKQNCSSVGCPTCLRLTDIYPTIADTEKNNYTHILVEKHCADQLYDFIQKGYISFTPNNQGKNPLDVALELFRASSIEKDASTRCCLFMLLNYVKKQQGITDFAQCCNKHTI